MYIHRSYCKILFYGIVDIKYNLKDNANSNDLEEWKEVFWLK